MSEIKLGEKSLAILKGISQIYQGVIVKEDYLYTKFDDTATTTGKGAENIIVEYKLPEGEIVTEDEFGLDDITEFLTVQNSFDAETLDIQLSGNAIKMKDGRKTVQYFTRTTESLPQKNVKGEELWESGIVKIGYALLETEKDTIVSDLSILKSDRIVMQCKDGGIILKASNKITGNETEIKLAQDKTHQAEDDFEFEFPNPNILSYIIPGEVYKIVVKEVQHGDNTIKIMKLYNSSITEGELSYTLVQAD